MQDLAWNGIASPRSFPQKATNFSQSQQFLTREHNNTNGMQQLGQMTPATLPMTSALQPLPDLSSMAFPNLNDRHASQFNPWSRDALLKLGNVDIATWHAALASETTIPPRSECSTSGSYSSGTTQSDTEDGPWDRNHLFEALPPFAGPGPPSSSDICSATPNARASRLFRERRKEREKVLRETVAELAERNAVLEATLHRHGVVPPTAATMRHDLSIHRAQRQGGPPIHIPGVTATRPPVSPPAAESNTHQGIHSAGEGDRHVMYPRSSAPSAQLDAKVGKASPYDREVRGTTDEWKPPPPGVTHNSTSVHSTIHMQPSFTGGHAVCQQPAQLPYLQPAAASADLSTGGARGPPPSQQAKAISTSMSLPTPSHGQSARMDAPSFSSPGPTSTTFVHSRAPSDSVLLAKLPELTLAEQQIAIAGSGKLPETGLPKTGHQQAALADRDVLRQWQASQPMFSRPSADASHRDLRLSSSSGPVHAPSNRVIKGPDDSAPGGRASSLYNTQFLGPLGSNSVW